MAHRVTVRTTFEASNVIQPIYTGGSVSLSEDGRILATTLGEDAILSDLATGEQLARVESVSIGLSRHKHVISDILTRSLGWRNNHHTSL